MLECIYLLWGQRKINHMLQAGFQEFWTNCKSYSCRDREDHCAIVRLKVCRSNLTDEEKHSQERNNICGKKVSVAGKSKKTYNALIIDNGSGVLSPHERRIVYEEDPMTRHLGAPASPTIVWNFPDICSTRWNIEGITRHVGQHTDGERSGGKDMP